MTFQVSFLLAIKKEKKAREREQYLQPGSDIRGCGGIIMLLSNGRSVSVLCKVKELLKRERNEIAK